MPDMTMTAEELRRARAQLGLTQSAMARALEMQLRGYQRWEGNERRISKLAARTVREMLSRGG
jgi:DNA-binding transcriptional regulator YiaG